MNKLTEIKERYAEPQVWAGDPEDVRYLLSLLEEKDKALAFYADEENNDYTIGMYEDLRESKVMIDGGDIARKALNTSSNNEGE